MGEPVQNASSDAKPPASNSNKQALALAAVAVLVALIAVLVSSGGGSDTPKGSITPLAWDGVSEVQFGGARLVDVRTTAEYERGSVPGAENVPLDQLAAVSDSWSRAEAIIVYCATGARSAEAARLLSDKGFVVYDVSAGIVGYDGGLGELVENQEPPASSGNDGEPTALPVMYDFSTNT